jgi:2-C-methyl-D-erythritol 4-phosphate cytidylyltransferase
VPPASGPDSGESGPGIVGARRTRAGRIPRAEDGWRAGTAPERLGPRDLWTVRRPFAFRREDSLRGLAAGAATDGLSEILARAGVSTALVPSPSWNVKVTTPDDRVVAQAIERSGREV